MEANKISDKTEKCNYTYFSNFKGISSLNPFIMQLQVNSSTKFKIVFS